MKSYNFPYAPQKETPLLEKFTHYLTGLIVILKGVDKPEHFGQHPFVPILLFVIGVSIIVATIFHHRLESIIKEFKTLLVILEGCALLLVSYSYFEAGKKALPFLFLFCALAYFIIAVVFYRKKVKRLRSV